MYLRYLLVTIQCRLVYIQCTSKSYDKYIGLSPRARMRFIAVLVTVFSLVQGTPPDYRSCPISCNCTSQSAICDSLNFESFKNNVLQLKLRNVQDPIAIDSEFFPRLNLLLLQSLTIENSTIKDLDPATFQKTEYLQILNFVNVTFPKLTADSFVFATQLQVLTIEGCGFEEFIPFRSESLEILKISKCPIKELTEESLINLPDLTDVTFSNNEIEKIDPKTFLNNYYLEELDLSNNKIAELPKGIFEENQELAALDLSGNPLKKIDASIMELVEKLILQNCSLKEFKGGKFADMGYLDLSNNEISEISSGTFGNMPDLEYLNLSHNKLKTLPSEIFVNNSRLQKIHLDYNEFEMLPKFVNYKETFPTYYFSCSECGLENLDENIFENMPKLVTLNLSKNRLQKITPKMLSYLTRLGTLDLSYNMISNLPLNVFENNSMLSNVNLAGNTIASLNPKLFHKNSNLKTLDISNNALKNIWVPTASQIPSLETLNLADNRLEVFTKSELEVSPNLKALNVNNNQFNCSAELDEAIQWLNKKSVEPSSLGTHAEFKDGGFAAKVYIGNYWRKLCGEDDYDGYDDENDDAEPTDIDEDEDDDDEDINDDEFGTYGLIENDDNSVYYEDVASTFMPARERYSFLWPLFIFIVTALIVLLVVTNIILCVLRKRGHLPRNINLTWKNAGQSGFVYKPLTEEIPRSSIIVNGVERNQTQYL